MPRTRARDRPDRRPDGRCASQGRRALDRLRGAHRRLPPGRAGPPRTRARRRPAPRAARRAGPRRGHPRPPGRAVPALLAERRRGQSGLADGDEHARRGGLGGRRRRRRALAPGEWQSHIRMARAPPATPCPSYARTPRRRERSRPGRSRCSSTGARRH